MKRKQIAFPVSSEEHKEIKRLAAKQRRTIKQLFLEMLDRFYPDWNKNKEDISEKETAHAQTDSLGMSLTNPLRRR